MKALLTNKVAADLGPIICVCYTNHALDQILEQLVKEDMKVIRIGSRSKSELLENLNLREVAGKFANTREERAAFYTSVKQLENLARDFNLVVSILDDCGSQKSLKQYLFENERDYHDEIFKDEPEEPGFTAVRHYPERFLVDWLAAKLTIEPSTSIGVEKDIKMQSSVQASTVTSHETPLEEERTILRQQRLDFYNGWVDRLRQNLHEELSNIMVEFSKEKQHFENVRSDRDVRVLKQADIIEVTTTGLAKLADMLGRVNSKVLVCEEAGEVLEAHVLTAMLPSIEHIILIGDHQQLRPHINNYELQHDNPRGKAYSLDVSIFERLIEPYDEDVSQLPYDTLAIQRRMHPSIAELVRQTSYPHLIDHNCTHTYPQVPGFQKRLFWFDHEHLETGAGEGEVLSISKSNDFEVDMIAMIVAHLIKQGKYAQDDIAVITPYLGQLQKLRQKLASFMAVVVADRDENDLAKFGLETAANPEEITPVRTTLLKSVRVATVDNFQGEEAKIGIISLVRSNHEARIGFLNSANRVNVLLSRAKHGMFIIGNATTYQSSQSWAPVIEMLQNNDNIGRGLPLQCPRHLDTDIQVHNPDQFNTLSPEGGCNKPCGQRLSCGHPCLKSCHSDMMHRAVRCLEECTLTLEDCNHVCPALCGEPCPKLCTVGIPDVQLPCGHDQDVLCHQTRSLNSVLCTKRITEEMPRCSHFVEIACHQQEALGTMACPVLCSSELDCGHTCGKPCDVCPASNDSLADREAEPHGTCQTICGRPYTTCRHSCRTICHQGSGCPPCLAPCEVKCSHSKCSTICSQPCTPCAVEICGSRCPHSACDLPCAAPCGSSWLPCNKRCEKLLECSCQCPSLCGEICPSSKFCQNCASDDIKAQIVDFFEFATYDEVDLNEMPCIFPACGHIQTVTSMDGLLGFERYYNLKDGVTLSAKSNSEPFSSTEIKACPSCRGSLREIARYGRIVRRGMLDEMCKKFMITSHQEQVRLRTSFATLNTSLEAMTENELDRFILDTAFKHDISLEGSRREQARMLFQLDGVKVELHRAKSLRKRVANFLSHVRETEQPLGRVFARIQHVKRSRDLLSDLSYDTNIVRMPFTVHATELALRLDLLLFSTFMRAYQRYNTRGDVGKLTVDLSHSRKDCRTLIAAAQEGLLPARQVEGHILFISFAALEFTFEASHRAQMTRQTGIALRDEARAHIQEAVRLCEKYPGSTNGLQPQIDQAARMLNDPSFYQPVSTTERMEVMAAMASEFSGTGHWCVTLPIWRYTGRINADSSYRYYCVNGHPFTIGECGMPMQVARCGQCGAFIGGTSHTAVEGVVRAEDLETAFAQQRIG